MSITSKLVTSSWVGGKCADQPASSRYNVYDPRTGRAVVDVSAAAPAQVSCALDAAQRSGLEWSQESPRRRAEILRNCFEFMLRDLDTISGIIELENGKSPVDARNEVSYAAEFFRWYSEEAVRIVGDAGLAPGGDKTILTRREPVGIAYLITPWNFPAAMATRKIAPALAAGCTVLLKPASQTPLTALYLAALLTDAGVPPGVINVLPTQDAAGLTDAVLEDARVRKLSFTGSTGVGSHLQRKCADRIVNASMELGGNAPFVVLEGADLDVALDAALTAKMRNGGQSCIAANRFYVHSSLVRSFTEQLTGLMSGAAAREFRGPLISEDARDGLGALVDIAAESGATIHCGGRAEPGAGWYYEPTVIGGVSAANPVLSEELFGPVAPIVEFESVDDMITQANATDYGLAAYVCDRDLSSALSVANRLEAGMVGINRGHISDPAAPFGGVKSSGLDREGARDGIRAFLETKYIAVNL